MMTTDNNNNNNNKDDEGNVVVAKTTTTAFITIHNIPIYFQEEWDTGIGGGLWSTGLALAKYFNTDSAVIELKRLGGGFKPISVLELGSGNGFLAVCFAAMAIANEIPIQNLVITDTNEHLYLINKIINANNHIFNNKKINNVTIMEHKWGEFISMNDCNSISGDIQIKVHTGTIQFDLIFGSDLAYRDYLYKPLIQSIQKFSNNDTVSLIGITMTDTKPEFFNQLENSRLRYQRFADHLLDPDFRGTTFGIFAIQRK